jgi:DNA repair exonuclease SbcCD ATPase subunit
MPKLEVKQILIEGFKSFKEKQVFNFSGTGFTFITGDNGSGKSSLASSLVWVGYGKSLEGTKASTTANWAGTNPCQGQLEFKLDGTEHYIYRAWNPNQLILDDNNVTQEEIDRLFGVNYEGFIRAVILAQAGESFIDAKPSEKLNIFCDILGLEFWQDCSKKASEKCKESSANLLTLNSKVESIKGSIGSWTIVLNNATKDFTNFEAMKAMELEKLDKQLYEARLVEKQLSSQINEYQTIVDEEKELYKAVGNKRSLLQIEVSKAEDQRREIKSKFEIASDKVKTLNQEITEYLSKSSVSCPTCGRPLDETKSKQFVHDKRSKSVELQQALTPLEAELLVKSKLVDETKQALAAFDKNPVNPPDYTKLMACRDSLSRQQQIIMGINQSMAPYLGANPHKKQLEAAEIELKTLNIQFTQFESSKIIIEKKSKSLEFWQDTFKELRLYIVDQALLEFEVEINYLLPQLGMKDWKVKLEVERETKSGSISKEFSVQVFPPGEDTPKDWSSWSAGQRQRLRIASSKGLMNLIKARTGLDVNFEIWDEPSVHLRPEYILGFLEYLKECSSGKQILLIDHNVPNYGDFDNTVSVTLDPVKGTILNVDK